MDKKQNQGKQTKTEGNALNIRGEQRHNIKMKHTQKLTKHQTKSDENNKYNNDIIVVFMNLDENETVV